MHPRSPRVRVRGFVSALPGGWGEGSGRGAAVAESRAPGWGSVGAVARESPRGGDALLAGGRPHPGGLRELG